MFLGGADQPALAHDSGGDPVSEPSFATIG